MIELLAVFFRIVLLLGALLSGGLVIVSVLHRLRVDWTMPVGLALIGAFGGYATQAAMLVGDVSGMWDTAILGLLWVTPQGNAFALQITGAILMLAARIWARRPLAIAGALVMLSGFSAVGHVADQDGFVLHTVLFLHLCLASYWVGILGPLHALAHSNRTETKRVAQEFGQYAMVSIPVLIALGGIMAVTLLENLSDLWTSTYGITLMLKLAGVAAMLCLGAANKVRHVPILAKDYAGAADALRRSLRWESFAAITVIVATAAFSTVAGLS
jgi:putative copper export protein